MKWAVLAAIAAALALAGWQTYRLSEERGAHAVTRAEFAEYREKSEAASRLAEQKNRDTEQELNDAQARINQQAQQLLDAQGGKARADRERNAAERMRDAAAAAATAARAQCSAVATPGYGTPGPDPIGVLADVLRRADARAGELAGIADDRRVRGLACEAFYDAARDALKD
jgi:ATPase subunit of ABC transporter with duplicated ATPase domains